MTDKIIRLKRLKEMTGLSASTILRQEKNGHFPNRIKISNRSVGWFESEVLLWINDKKYKSKQANRVAIIKGIIYE